MENLLQRFLDAGMLSIGDDTKFTSLKTAAGELAKRWGKDRSKLIPATLVALDSHITSDDELLGEVQGVIKKGWPTFRAVFPGEPTQLLRFVLLESLRVAGAENALVAACVRLTGDSYFLYADLANEREVCRELLHDLRRNAEAAAVQAWASAPVALSGTDVSLSLNAPQLSYGVVDEKKLTTHLGAASGPQNQQGQSYQDANPSFPTASAVWTDKFGSRAAKGIAEVVNAANATTAGNVHKLLTGVVEDLNGQLPGLVEAIASAAQSVSLGVAAQERKVNLLWWREALYSPTLDCSYRDLEAPIAALALAGDLSRQLPALCPVSVEFFGREAACEAIVLQDTIRLDEALSMMLRFPRWMELKAALGVKYSGSQRMSLLRYLLSRSAGAVDASEFPKLLGLRDDTQVRPQDLAIWLFRDLQAEKLAGKGA